MLRSEAATQLSLRDLSQKVQNNKKKSTQLGLELGSPMCNASVLRTRSRRQRQIKVSCFINVRLDQGLTIFKWQNPSKDLELLWPPDIFRVTIEILYT